MLLHGKRKGAASGFSSYHKLLKGAYFRYYKAYSRGRTNAGYSSQSIMWGPWASGMAASDSRIAARFSAAGLGLLTPFEGMRLLEKATAQRSSYTNIVAAHISWPKLLSAAKRVPKIFSACAEGLQPKPGARRPAESSMRPEQKLPSDLTLQKISEIVEAMLGLQVPHDQVFILQ